MTKRVPKKQANWRLSERAREIVRVIAETDRRSQGVTLEIILDEEAKRRGLVVKTK